MLPLSFYQTVRLSDGNEGGLSCLNASVCTWLSGSLPYLQNNFLVDCGASHFNKRSDLSLDGHDVMRSRTLWSVASVICFLNFNMYNMH